MAMIVSNLNQVLGGYFREAVAVIRAVSKPTTYHQEKFVLFGRGRSGSTLLTDLLNQSDEIDCDKEIFNRKVMFPRLFLKLRNRAFPSRVYGFKLLSYQLKDILIHEDGREFLRYLSEDKGYKIVFLTRSNLVRQTLSKHYARYRQTWHQSESLGKPEKMVVDIPAFMSELRHGKALEEYEEYCLAGIPHFKVNYEEDLLQEGDRIRLYDRLTNYLGISFKLPKSNLKKISPQNIGDFVANWEELKLCLSYTEFSGDLG